MLNLNGRNFLKPILVSICLCFAMLAQGQNQSYLNITDKIDSLADLGLPKSALAEVGKLDSLARSNKDNPQQIRAVIYRINFMAYLEENAITAIISQLKQDVDMAGYPVKPVLQSLLAEMYWKYYQQNRWQFSQRTPLTKPDSDFTRWDLKTIINQSRRLYQLSLKEDVREQATPINVLDGALAGDTATRYLRPTLYDFLVHRALDFYLNEEPSLTEPAAAFKVNDPVLFGEAGLFAKALVASGDTASLAFNGITLLKNITQFHLADRNNAAVADIDLKRLEFVLRKSVLPEKDSLYVHAVQKLAVEFSANALSADALVLLGKYYQEKDSLKTAVGYLEKAQRTYPGSMGGKNGAILLKQINKQEISAQVEEAHVPGKPILSLLNYRNINEAELVFYKVSVKQVDEYLKIPKYQRIDQPDKVLSLLNGFSIFRNSKVAIPNPADYKMHSTEIAISPLPVGQYIMLLKVSGDTLNLLANTTFFQVSQLAFVARGTIEGTSELVAMDRQTGTPLKNIRVNVERKSLYQTALAQEAQTGVTDVSGKFKFTENNRYQSIITLSRLKDTLARSSNFYGYNEQRIESTSSIRTTIFTDRQLYRPGQVVYFKGLQISYSNGKSAVIANASVSAWLKDANGKELSTIKMTTNEFGTFTGSFVLPQSMLNGQITLGTDNGMIWLQVEEYKRPTFQVRFDPIKATYKPGDSVTVTGKVNSFAGYGLTNAVVAYRITRTFSNDYYGYGNYMTQLKEDTLQTDSKGGFSIKFKALRDGRANKDAFFAFVIHADVTDASGETRSDNITIKASTKPLALNMYLPAMLLERDTVKVPLSMVNLNGQLQEGAVDVKVYALKSPDRLFKNRFWNKPDQWLITENDYKTLFPAYAYKTEDQFQYWEKLKEVAVFSVKTDTGKVSELPRNILAGMPPGMYRFELAARNANGDTVSVVRYSNWITANNQPASVNNWVIPWKTRVLPGEAAEYLLGTGIKNNILMEVYDGRKLLSEQWLETGPKQLKKSIPISADFSKNLRVQFLMLSDNRLYIKNETVFVIKNNNKLNVRLSSYRNVLQPGDKEKWTVQIEGADSEKNAVELLASMYDSSLDDIASPLPWGIYLEGGYVPFYNVWQTIGFSAAHSIPSYSNNTSASLLFRRYEALDMLGYNYYGGYNFNYRNYLSRLEQKRQRAEFIENLYQKNAALVKNGYEMNGLVLDEKGKPLSDVTIWIRGTSISGISAADGKYKIRVPVNGVVVFSKTGYLTQEFGISKNVKISITLKRDPNSTISTNGTISTEAIGTEIRIRGSSSILNDAVNAKRYEDVGAASVEQALQGRLPGVDIGTSGSGTQLLEQVVVRDPNYKVSDYSSDTLSFKRPAAPRTNFAETAFFYPQLRTNEKGEILFEFTAPDALTRWKFRALAHTKDLKVGALTQADIITQKQLMITANAPRFFREGDTITVSARLANLTKNAIKARVELKLFDGLFMQPINLLSNTAQANQEVAVDGATNKAVSFKLYIPSALDAITYRLTVEAGAFSDGEESTIPVLPNSMLVTESMPMLVRSGQTKTFTLNKLATNTSTTLRSKTLTLEFTQNPTWYAVQALPYLMEFPYECAEQTFSRYYANAMASSIVNRQTVIKRVFEQWKASNSTALLSNLEKNQELKTMLLEETPWLRSAESETEQKKRIALLFDMNRMSNETTLNLSKLANMQMQSGGFPWFAGSRYDDRYITQHIIAGIGQLKQLSITDTKGGTLNRVSTLALQYLDIKILEDHNDDLKRDAVHNLYPITIHAWYARSYFTDVAVNASLRPALDLYLKQASTEWRVRSVYEQALIATTMLRYGKAEIAQMIIRSLGETAQRSEELGMYWGKNQLGYYWYQSPIETQALMIELFTEAGGKEKDIEEMKIWLLRNKQTNNWKTTKATAAACYALLLRGNDWLETGTSEISLGAKSLSLLKPDTKAEAGTGYLKTNWTGTEITPQLAKVELKNSSKIINWGALYWQYTETLDKITSSETNIELERKYFITKETANGTVLSEVSASNAPHIGDLLKVVVYLKADRDFEYVHLKDMRPSGTEPGNILSGYKYQDGLFYYQMMKDASANFFISKLPKGNYVFEYNLRVAQPGNFSTGISSVQCMYAPEFNAHSEGKRMEISK